eukprot:9732488-Alexandrium_andersonii.AAC.1
MYAFIALSFGEPPSSSTIQKRPAANVLKRPAAIILKRPSCAEEEDPDDKEGDGDDEFGELRDRLKARKFKDSFSNDATIAF